MGQAPDCLGERGELIAVRTQGGDEKDVGLVCAEVAQQLGLAYTPAAVKDEQFCTN